MEITLRRKTWQVYAFDVESRNDAESVAKGETSIWLASLVDERTTLEDKGAFFYDIASCVDRFAELGTPRYTHDKRLNGHALIYAFNLSFEFSFILPELVRRGFTWSPSCDEDEPMTYSVVASSTARNVWLFRVCFAKGGLVEFRDLAKLFPCSLRTLAKSFGLKTQKGEIDYEKPRPAPYVPTEQEYRYNLDDNKIVVEILQIMKQRGDKAFFRSLSAGSYSAKKAIESAYPRSDRPLKDFRRDYPELGPDETAFLRHSVAGGISYATPHYQFKDVRNVRHFDIHQAHPNSMVRYEYPYGRGRYFRGTPRKGPHISSCCHVTVSFSGVRLHSVIGLIGLVAATDKELWLWDFELDTMKKAYIDLEVRYIDGYEYSTKPLPWVGYIKDNYERRLKAKAAKDDFLVAYYKLLNNSFYGKLLEHTHLFDIEPILSAAGEITSVAHKREGVDEGNDNAAYTYIPVGSSIPAHTRCYLVESALTIGWDKVTYFDTDSIFFIDDPETRESSKRLSVGPDLGQWGEEAIAERAQFTAPKRYKLVEREGGNVVVHMAGVNFPTDEDGNPIYGPYEGLNLVDGDFPTKTAKRVKGGTVIVRKVKKLGVQTKYTGVYEANKGGIIKEGE